MNEKTIEQALSRIETTLLRLENSLISHVVVIKQEMEDTRKRAETDTRYRYWAADENIEELRRMYREMNSRIEALEAKQFETDRQRLTSPA